MAYSIETRINALKDCVNGQTDEQVSAKHGVSTYTISNWKKLLITTGSLDKKKVQRKSGTPYKYTPEKLKEQLDKSRSAATATAAKAVKAQDAPKVKTAKDEKSSPKAENVLKPKDSKKEKKKKKKKAKKGWL